MGKNLIRAYERLPVQIKASFWFLVCAFLQKGISMLTTPIFTRLLTTAEYGQYNVFNSWLNIVAIFVSLNLSAGVYGQGLVKYEKERQTYASSMQGLNLSLVLVWTVVYLVFRSFWNRVFSLTTIQMLAMLVLIWTGAVFQFWAAEQRVRFHYRALVVITLLVSLVKPFLGIILVQSAGDKVTARILGLALVEFIGYSGLFLIQMFRGKRFFSRRFWYNALLFNIPLIPHYLSQSVLSGADRIMIDSMVGESAAGIYSLAYSLSMIMTMLNTALMQTISPWMYQKMKENRIGDISKVAYGTLVMVAGVNLVLILFAPEVVAVFAPASYYEAIWVVPPVAMSVYFMFSYDLFAKFAFYYERTGLITAASVAGAVLNVALNYVFITIFGYRAAGYTTLFCYIIYDVFHYCFMQKICRRECGGKTPYDTGKILMITVVFLVCGMVLLFTYYSRFIRYGIAVTAGLAAIHGRDKIRRFVLEIMSVRGRDGGGV